ncbi:MAG: nitrogenase component 1, partial [Synergistaceae bacterium]
SVDFTDCYMTPIMRKTWISPDSKMREQLYSLLKPAPIEEKTVNIIGNNYPTEPSSDFVRLLEGAGWKVRDICHTKSYSEYQEMASSKFNIVYNPAAKPAAETLKHRLGQDCLYMPLSFDYNEIILGLTELSKKFSLPMPDTAALIKKAESELQKTAELLGDTAIAIDYTVTTRPLGLARLLLAHGMNVVSVYGDVFSPEEKADFDWLRENAEDLMLYATVHPKMGLIHKKAVISGGEKIIALGQKAAYFTATNYFVNILEGGGLHGFDGVCKMAALIREAAVCEKDTEKLIQIKGWGCCC